MRRIFLILIHLIYWSTLSLAQSQVDSAVLWQQGQQLYEQGNFADAVQCFEKLQQQFPGNGHVLYNLGNSYYKNNQKGAAMAAYLASQRLLPRDPDIRANLNFVAKNLNINPDIQITDGIGRYFFPHLLVMNERDQGWLLVGILTLLLLGVGLYIWKSQRTAGIFILLLLLLALYQSAATAMAFADHRGAIGAVISAKVSAYAGPQRDGAFPEVFQLQEGYPVIVLEKRPQWLLIALPDGRKGWLLSTDIAFF